MILDRRGKPGEFVERPGQSVRSPAGTRHRIQPGMDLHRPAKIGHAASERLVRLTELDRCLAFGADHLCDGEGQRRLLHQHIQEQVLLGAGFLLGEQHQEAPTPLRTAEGERESPFGIGHTESSS